MDAMARNVPLAYPYPELTFEIHPDACGFEIGAILL